MSAIKFRVGQKVVTTGEADIKTLSGEIVGGPTLVGEELLWPVLLTEALYTKGDEALVSVLLLNQDNLTPEVVPCPVCEGRNRRTACHCCGGKGEIGWREAQNFERAREIAARLLPGTPRSFKGLYPGHLPKNNPGGFVKVDFEDVLSPYYARQPKASEGKTEAALAELLTDLVRYCKDNELDADQLWQAARREKQR